MSRWKRVSIGLAVAAGVIYGMDDLSGRFGVPARPRYSTVTVRRYYFIHEKYNKFSYEPLPVIDEECANTLLPHWGARPCWWVKRHRVVNIDVG
jgi:hypothetical protein